MKNLTAQAVYNADIYLRLSDDDGDKPESNSIKNQREFITEFLKSMPEIRIHAERKDDGFSGVDFFRPGIQEVLNVCTMKYYIMLLRRSFNINNLV